MVNPMTMKTTTWRALASLPPLLAAIASSGCGTPGGTASSVSPPPETTPFQSDVAFLRRHTELAVLGATGGAQIAVAPKWQGRVMTSTAGGERGLSHGWINRELIRSGEIQPHINVFGGEDRFWLGPEGGQYSLFFKSGDPFDLEHWQTPALIDTEPFPIVWVAANAVSFERSASITNYSGTRFDMEIRRTIRLIGEQALRKTFGVRPDNTEWVAFESENRVTNIGTTPWLHGHGLPSIWILGMFEPSPRTTVVIPYRPSTPSNANAGTGTEAANSLRNVVNDAYFGKVPPDRLAVTGKTVFFKGDGQSRSKIGIGPIHAESTLGSFDPERGVLTVVQFNRPEGAMDYVNSMWELQDAPYRGDVVNSYNDGPPEAGAKPLGPFYELETSSPAAALPPNESITHFHRTAHFTGSTAELDRIARALLGVGLKEIEEAL